MDTPNLDQLGRIASTVKRQYWPDGSMPCGITHEDLVSEGYLAYVAAKRFPWARARYAMIDYLCRIVAPVSGRLVGLRAVSGGDVVPVEEGMLTTDDQPSRSPVRDVRLRRGDIQALRTFAHRRLSERKARVAIRTLIDGESIELVADELGITKASAIMMRSQAFGEIRTRIACD